MCGKFSVVWCKSAFDTVQMKNCTYTVPKNFGIASFWGANVSREKVSRRKFNKNRKTCSLAVSFAQKWQKFCGKFRRKQVKLNICCCLGNKTKEENYGSSKMGCIGGRSSGNGTVFHRPYCQHPTPQSHKTERNGTCLSVPFFPVFRADAVCVLRGASACVFLLLDILSCGVLRVRRDTCRVPGKTKQTKQKGAGEKFLRRYFR